MKPFRWLRSLIALTAAMAACPAHSAEFRYPLCARGVSHSPERPFTKTVKLVLVTQGAALPDNLVLPLAQQLTKQVLWPDQAIEAFVERDLNHLCPAIAGAAAPEIAVSVTQEQVRSLSAEVVRSPDWKLSIHAHVGKISVSLSRGEEITGPAKQWMRIFYGSNRNRTGTASVEKAFGNNRVDNPGFGAVDVAVPYRPQMKDTQSPAIFKTERLLAAETLELGAQLHPMSLDQWKRDIAERALKLGKPGVLVFFHGFNVPFASAARQAAQLAYDLTFPGPIVFFAWPSDGVLPSYLRDGRDAENSSIAAARLLTEVTANPDVRVYIIAHSMGNRVMTEAYKRFIEEHPERITQFVDIVMAAPDIDQESFRLFTANKILPSGPRFTLYASKRDLALSSSEFLQGGRRLGFGGESMYVQNNLDSIDASAVTREFFGLNHSYFRDTSTVMYDLANLILYHMPANQRPNLRPIRVNNKTAYSIVPLPG